MKKMFLLLALAAFSGGVFAQCSFIKDQMVKDWERAKAYTRDYLETMPADKYNFKAQDSVRTFAQQMLHLAQGNIGLASNATDKAMLWGRRDMESAAAKMSKDSVIYYVMASYDYVIEGVKGLEVSKFEEKVNKWNFDETRYAWLLKAFEHQTHHRGQATIYIRLVGIRPPMERLF